LKTEEEEGKGDVWGALITSAKRRRRSTTSSSPLAAVVEEEKNVSAEYVEMCGDTDGDTSMMTAKMDTSSTTEPSNLSSPSPSSTAGSVAMDMLKDLMKRKTSRHGRTCLTRESTYSVPMLTVSKTVVAKVDEDVGSGDPEAMLDVEFPMFRCGVSDVRESIEQGA
jgi:hypothetical protein